MKTYEDICRYESRFEEVLSGLGESLVRDRDACKYQLVKAGHALVFAAQKADPELLVEDVESLSQTIAELSVVTTALKELEKIAKKAGPEHIVEHMIAVKDQILEQELPKATGKVPSYSSKEYHSAKALCAWKLAESLDLLKAAATPPEQFGG